ELLACAALSISQAGYNTVMDLLVARCPAIIVPFATGGETEQTFRAKRFETMELLHHLEEQELTANTLCECAVDVVRAGRKSGTGAIDLNGAKNTGKIIAGLAQGI
ncbi:MAG: glycosyltransferase, partial [Hyphomicrobiaceae bacterium]